MQNKQIGTSDISSQPLVSFIITTYNLPGELLQKCICSIISLSLSECEREIILVDDGSEMSPLDDLSEYQDQITYVRQQNQGPSAARNNAISLARGKYIQFVDGDDCLLTHAYEHCLDIIKLQSPDIVLFEMTSSKPRNVKPTAKYYGPVEGRLYMLHHNIHASACSYVFRSSILGQLRFTPGSLHEDEEFTPMLFLRAEKMVVIADKAYYYKRREGSIMTETRKEHVDKRLADTEQILFRLKDKVSTLPQIEQMALERRVSQLTMDHLYRVAALKGSVEQLDKVIERLKQHALYPLPNKNYTPTYTFFRCLIRTAIGRKALVNSLKFRKHNK